MRNLSELKIIKDIHNKILTSQNLIALDLFASIAARPKVPYSPVYDKRTLPHTPPVTEHVSKEVIKKFCSLIAHHVGYDSISKLALETLSDIATKYISDISRTIGFYMYRFNGMEHIDILNYSLHENGVDDANCLYEYIKRDIVSYGKQLYELRLRMEYAYTYLDQDDDDIDLDKHDDQIIRHQNFNSLVEIS